MYIDIDIYRYKHVCACCVCVCVSACVYLRREGGRGERPELERRLFIGRADDLVKHVAYLDAQTIPLATWARDLRRTTCHGA
jgi:hypothetical protein